jgi:carboxymethylenebutenolidase
MATPKQIPAVENLIQDYRRGGLSRREFFQKLAFVTGSILLAHEIMLAEGLASYWEAYDWPSQEQAQRPPQPTPAESIAAGEKRLPNTVTGEWVNFPSGEFKIGAYLAKPKTGAPHAAIVVIHENRGLTEFVIDIAQRWASEGFIGLAVDCLSRVGGTQKFDSMQAAGEGIRSLQRSGVMEDLHAAVAYLKSRKDVRKDVIGVTGFCWGGGNSFAFVTESKEIAFAMPFYGPPPPVERAGNISVPIRAVFAENDQRVNANVEAFAAKMKELGKAFDYKFYPGTGHAFMNFTGTRYNEEQSRVAWADVTAFAKGFAAKK